MPESKREAINNNSREVVLFIFLVIISRNQKEKSRAYLKPSKIPKISLLKY
jgi:hypothetical protein